MLSQIHGKNDLSANLLVSRKRKLSSLYAATLNLDHSLQQDYGPTYHAQLQAFLDANDLAKGKRFDETTLPPRPQIATTPPYEQSVQPYENSIDPVDNRRSRSRTTTPQATTALSSLHHPVRKPSPLPSTNGDIRTRITSSEPFDDEVGSQPIEDTAKRKRVGDEVLVVKLDQDASATPGAQERASTRSRTGSQRATPVPVATSPPSLGNHVLTNCTASRSTPDRRDAKAQGTLDRYISIPSQSRRSKSPLVLAPAPNIVDPQSSPASTDGPGSTNTPAPTTGSPTTSPGDEEPPDASQDLEQQKAAHEIVAAPMTVSHKEQQPRPESMDLDIDNSAHQKVQSPGAINIDEVPAHDKSTNPVLFPPPVSVEPVKDGNSRRPTMRIDTQTDSYQDLRTRITSSIMASPGPLTGQSTPRRQAAPSVSTPDVPRRATRIASGALRQKSVSEIMGETPKLVSPSLERLQTDRSAVESPSTLATRDAFDLGTSHGRLADRERREKERSKLSTVVFAKPVPTQEDDDTIEVVRRTPGETGDVLPKQRDYLYTLFESRAYSSPRSTTLSALIQSAHKTVSTVDHLVDYQEQMNCRTLKRIYQLQNANRWPLRQLKRAAEPVRLTSHWDFLLDHAKWMRTDFREERKWKMATARGVAEWCAEWVMADEETRKQLQVAVRPPTRFSVRTASEDITMEDQPAPAWSSHPTPDLLPSAEEDSVIDGEVADPREITLGNAPAAIFSLNASDFIFSMDKTPAADKILNELPLYEPARIEPDLAKSDLAERLDAKWKKSLVPISRYAEGKLHVQDRKAPSRHSRYDYALEDATDHESVPLPPEQTDVALFMPENKHTRDRIHPGHSFRPPSEHPMPTQQFFESRSSSQWTHAEDDELRKLVKDYSYNWSLISSCLSPKSLFSSGADRRTPWECFERWIGLEGLPADMSKTPYFRAYHSRIEAAGRHVAAQLEAARRQAGNQMQIPARKRTTQPVRVERKRTQKHLAMLDAMRKLAKKRETALQKQQHAADLAAMRKVNEATQPKPPHRTPAEFSQLKHEREVKYTERQELYRQQVLASQRAAAQARQQGHVNGVPNNVPRGPAHPPNGVPPIGPASIGPNGNLAVPQPGHPRAPPMPNGPNGMPNGPQMLRGGGQQMTAAQMQAFAAVGGTSPEQMRAHAERVKAHQQALIARQAQQNGGMEGNHSSPNMPNASMVNGNTVNNNAYMAAMAAAGGQPSPSGMPNGNAGSPRTHNVNMAQALSSGNVPAIAQIAASIRANNPEMGNEEVQRIASEQLVAWHQKVAAAQGQKHRNQAALNAAMGAANAGQAAYGPRPGMMTNEQVHQYNQQMRMQAAQQRASVQMNVPMGPGMMNGMTGSPNLAMARPVSQHASQRPLSRSATPRDQRSGSLSGMAGQGSPRGSQLNMQS